MLWVGFWKMNQIDLDDDHWPVIPMRVKNRIDTILVCLLSCYQSYSLLSLPDDGLDDCYCSLDGGCMINHRLFWSHRNLSETVIILWHMHSLIVGQTFFWSTEGRLLGEMFGKWLFLGKIEFVWHWQESGGTSSATCGCLQGELTLLHSLTHKFSCG